MNPDLEKLIDLHRAETELRRLDTELGEIPKLRQTLDDRVARDKGRLEAAREAFESSQKTRKQNETAVQDLEERRSKYKGQLMDVKTNKEYTAMLHEIETVEKEIGKHEDQILEEMERAEGLAADVKREEGAFKEIEKESAEKGKELDAQQARLEDERKRVATERDRVAEQIPEGPLNLYQRVAKLRGTGAAEAKDGMCLACHGKMRPQVWVELKTGEHVFQCDACNRILYYDPPPTVVEP